MTYEEFATLLSPYFTPEQIAHLNEIGYESADSCIRESDEEWESENNGWDSQDEYLAYAGRRFVCENLLWDRMDDDDEKSIEEIRIETGITMTAENVRALRAKMDEDGESWYEI